MKDYTGRRSGKLTAVSFLRKIPQGQAWLCLCDCGKTTELDISKIVTKQTMSCGCLRYDKISVSDRRFNKFKTKAWNNMNKRVVNGKYKNSSYINKSAKKVGRLLLISRDEFNIWCDSQKDIINEIYNANMRPSVDRIDEMGHYERNNLQILEFKMNLKKYHETNKMEIK